MPASTGEPGLGADRRREREQLEELPNTVREAVLETLALIQLEPEAMGKRPVGRLEGLWSARVGSYRVLYTLEPSGIVRSIRHRGVAYRSRRRER